MTRRRLPSLKGLAAFDAFATAGSMVRAAEALGVTHGAVSRQVKALERQLGAKLIEGPKHALALTPAGRRLAAATAEGFDRIAAGLPGFQSADELVVSAPGAFAMKWLIPRLPDFQGRHPGARVRILEDDGPVDFGLRGVQAAIRLRQGPAPGGQRSRPFLAHAFGPVLSPSLLQSLGGDLSVALQAPRLSSDTFPDGWTRWAAASKTRLPEAASSQAFEHNAYMLEAAAAGLGVAITAWAFAEADIAQGRLAAPWGFAPLATRFHLLSPALASGGLLAIFEGWLVAEGRRAAPPVGSAPRPLD